MEGSDHRSVRRSLLEYVDVIASEYNQSPFWVLNLDLDQFNALLDSIRKRRNARRVNTLLDTRLSVLSAFSEDAVGELEDFITLLETGKAPVATLEDLTKMGFGNA